MGGTIADIWEPHEFVFAYFHNLALTLHATFQTWPTYGCFLLCEHGNQWSWVYHFWLAGARPPSPVEVDPADPSNVGIFHEESCYPQMTIGRSVNGAYFLIGLFIMEETRSHIILRSIAKKLRKETGDDRYRARGDETRKTLSAMIKTSCTRPISKSFDVCCGK